MKHVLSKISYGIYSVGSKMDHPVGCIANSVMQITSDPSTVAISINHNNYTNEIIKKTGQFSVSILSEKVDPSIIGTFGYQSSRKVDKYKNVETEELAGFPLLKNSCGGFVCRVVATTETSTHTIFIGEVIAQQDGNSEIPMTYRYYQEVLKGKSPQNAPTYVPEESSDQTQSKKSVWRCKVCGYTIEADTLPEDFVCPVCGQPVSAFVKIEV